MARIYVFLADGFEEIEGLTVVDLLRRAQEDVIMVSVGESLTVTGGHGIQVQADCLLDACRPETAAMLVLPGGGVGTQNLGKCTALHEMLRKGQSLGQYLAAICAAPSVLGDLGLLNGRRAVCYPGFEDRLKGALVTERKVEIDGPFITSRGMGTAIPFGLALIEVLQGREAAKRIKDSILYGHRKQTE